MKEKLIYLTTDIPNDLRSGYKIRIYNLMKKFATKYELIVLHVSDKAAEPSSSLIAIDEYHFVKARTKSVRTLISSYIAGFPFLAHRFSPKDINSKVTEILRTNDVTSICLNMTVYKFECPESINIYIDQHDIISHTMREAASGSSGLLRRLIYKIETSRWIKYERQYYRKLDRVSTKILSVKDGDRVETQNLVNLSSVYTVPNGHNVVSRELIEGSREHFNPQLLFVGTSHERNINALRAFYENVLPLIHNYYPNIKTKIVGAFEASDLAFIKAKGKNISICTYVDDISKSYEYGDIQVLPFKMGAGSKLKVFESFAYGVPVVGTKLAFTGVPLGEIDNLVCSDSYETIAKNIINLIENKYSYDYVQEKIVDISRCFSWGVILEDVEWL